MFAGPPLPLSPEFPLAHLIELLNPVDLGHSSTEGLGVWLRGLDGAISLVVSGRRHGRCCKMLLSGDLGLLLGRCSQIAVRDGCQARVLAAEALIHWRALQVVTGMPCLPAEEKLREIFPAAVLDPAGFRIALTSIPPEAVLAECIRHGITVTETRIVYQSGAAPSL
ncbi:MAG TPA: hypothetical protein VFD73_25290 [Gemmatimonadales bacterium]|nr:hypothetical protein [Gemmatimonadales bacterium]